MRFLLMAALLAVSTSAYASPEIHVRIASVADAAERASYVEVVKRSLRTLEAASIDVVVSKLAIAANGEVSAKIEVVLSTAAGMRSIASGSAAFVAPRHQLRNAPALRREALGHALDAVHRRCRTVAMK